jgi:hypothetical protein
VLMTSQTSSVILGPFNGDLSSTWLAFGPAFPVPGIAWTFTATAPPGDSGYVAGTQLVNARTAFTPPASVPNTNGSYWLDACPLYDVAKQAGGGAGGANKTFLWESNDSPGINLTFASAYNLVSAAATFAIYFMYRPGGSQSIWVPLGKLNWFWRGTASRTGNPLVNHGWLGPTDAAASAAPTGTASSTFPQWSQVMLPDPNCPTLPTH